MNDVSRIETMGLIEWYNAIMQGWNYMIKTFYLLFSSKSQKKKRYEFVFLHDLGGTTKTASGFSPLSLQQMPFSFLSQDLRIELHWRMEAHIHQVSTSNGGTLYQASQTSSSFVGLLSNGMFHCCSKVLQDYAPIFQKRCYIVLLLCCCSNCCLHLQKISLELIHESFSWEKEGAWWEEEWRVPGKHFWLWLLLCTSHWEPHWPETSLSLPSYLLNQRLWWMAHINMNLF